MLPRIRRFFYATLQHIHLLSNQTITTFKLATNGIMQDSFAADANLEKTIQFFTNP